MTDVIHSEAKVIGSRLGFDPISEVRDLQSGWQVNNVFQIADFAHALPFKPEKLHA